MRINTRILILITIVFTAIFSLPSMLEAKNNLNKERVQLRIYKIKQAYKVGEPLRIRVEVSNIGAKPVSVPEPNIGALKIYKRRKTKNENNKKHLMQVRTTSAAYRYESLKPGNTITNEISVTPNQVLMREMPSPGTYEVQVSLLGKVFSNKLNLRVKGFPNYKEKYGWWLKYRGKGSKEEKFKVAREYISKYRLAKDPISYQLYRAYLNRAINYNYESNKNKIRQVMERAIRNFGEQDDLLKMRADFLKKQGRIRKVIKNYVKVSPEDAIDIYEEGVIRNKYKFREKYSHDELVKLGKLLVANTKGTLKQRAVVSLAFVYEKNGEVKKAIEILKTTKYSEDIIEDWREKHDLKEERK